MAAMALGFVIAEGRGWTAGDWYEGHFSELVQRRGTWWAAVGLSALLAGDLVLPVPSSVLMTLAGALFGTWAGALISFSGAMIGALSGFYLCRRLGRKVFERMIGPQEAARVERVMEQYGVWAILLSRSVPMMTEAVSCLAGLSRLPGTTFILLAAAGTAPLCLAYAWAGSRTGSGVQSWGVFLAFVLPALGFAWLKRQTGKGMAPRKAPMMPSRPETEMP